MAQGERRRRKAVIADREAARAAIRAARLRAGLTREQAAARIGHETSTVSRWEGGSHPKTWEELSEYAHRLDQEIVLRFGPPGSSAPPWAQELRAEMQLIATAMLSIILPPEQLDAAADRLQAYLEQRRRRGGAASGGRR